MATCITPGCSNPVLRMADEPRLIKDHVNCRLHYDRWMEAFRTGAYWVKVEDGEWEWQGKGEPTFAPS